MNLLKLLDKEILIRLTEGGFVETVRRFGMAKSLAYQIDESESPEFATSDERLTFAYLRARRNKNIP